MRKRLIPTALAAVALATPGAASALGVPSNQIPASPGACNMLHSSEQGLDGMMNDRQVYGIMLPLVGASFGAGCTP